jgi:hypothetical protein
MRRNISIVLIGAVAMSLVAGASQAAGFGAHGYPGSMGGPRGQSIGFEPHSDARAVPQVKPIKTPKQCYRVCRGLAGTTEDFCAWSCMR